MVNEQSPPKRTYCPNCKYPVVYIYEGPEYDLETGKGKIQRSESKRYLYEWKCDNCGNNGYIYDQI